MKTFKKLNSDNLSYMDINNEDDFFDIINPVNSENTIIQFYKEYVLVNTYEYFNSLKDYETVSEFIQSILPKIYEDTECIMLE